MCRNISGECSCTGGGGGGDATSLQGATWQSPLGIGTVAPAAGVFTTATITTANVTTENVSVSNVTTQLNALAINVSGLSASQLVATDGAKNLVSSGVLSVLPAADSVVKRDVDSNVYANNFVGLLDTIITTGGTTTLTTASAHNILFTGTTTQNIKMPKANDWSVTGASFDMNNNSTGIITIRNFGAGIIGTIPGGGYARLVNTDISSANGVWDIHAYLPAGPTWGTADLITPTTLTTTNSTNATSTTTGSFQTLGGMGIVKDLWVGGTLNVNGSTIQQGFINVNFNHTRSTWIAGAATNMTLSNSGFGLMGVFNGPGVPALNDSFRTVEFQILPGTYTLSVVTSRLSNRGLITWYLDASIVALGTMDLYLNGVDTIVQTIPSVVIPASVNNSHTLRAVITKNGASTGYFIYLSDLWFK